MKKTDSRHLTQVFLRLLIALGFFMVGTAVAGVGSAPNLGGIAANVTGSLGNLAKLITAGSYVAGLGFAIGSVLKFKAHKDNPTQVPVGTPIALVFIAAALVFLPSIFKASGLTMFGSQGGYIAGVSGITNFGASTITQ